MKKYFAQTIEGIKIITDEELTDDCPRDLAIGDILWMKEGKLTHTPPVTFTETFVLRDDVLVYLGSKRDWGAITPDYSGVPKEAMPYAMILREEEE